MELIPCERRSLWQSAEACRDDWLRARHRRPEPWQSRWHCLNCPIGAARAGRSVALAGSEVLETTRTICVRCQRPVSRIVGGRFCVSCYNRDRELLRGRNGKGAVPTVLIRRYDLHDRQVVVGLGAGAAVQWTFTTLSRVSGLTEAVLTLSRQVHQALQVGRTAWCTATRQLSFWGGC